MAAVLLCLAGIGVARAQTDVTSGGTPSAQQQGRTPATGKGTDTASPQTIGGPQPSNLKGNEAISDPLPALPVSVWVKGGTNVAAVRFGGVTFDEKNAIYSELQQKAGTPLDPDKVRADLRRLFATGLYRNVAVYGETAAGGLTLVFAGEPRFFVGRVTIQGVKSDRLASLLEFSTKLDPGAAFTDGCLAAGCGRSQRRAGAERLLPARGE